MLALSKNPEQRRDSIKYTSTRARLGLRASVDKVSAVVTDMY